MGSLRDAVDADAVDIGRLGLTVKREVLRRFDGYFGIKSMENHHFFKGKITLNGDFPWFWRFHGYFGIKPWENHRKMVVKNGGFIVISWDLIVI